MNNFDDIYDDTDRFNDKFGERDKPKKSWQEQFAEEVGIPLYGEI